MSSNEAGRPNWRRATFCQNSECIEVGQRDDLIILRDSAEPQGIRLSYRAKEWRSFVRDIRAGKFEHLRS